VYYDASLNPFGAPAPGQPRLYFADPEGQTTTMDSNLAIVPLRLRPKFDEERGNSNEGTSLPMGNKRRWDQREEATHPYFPPPPAPIRKKVSAKPARSYKKMPFSRLYSPNLPYHKPTSPPPKHEPQVEDEIKEAAKEEKLEIDLSKPPPLPAPSKAVQRAAKRDKKNSMADIWASQDELMYEQAVGGGSMEGILEQEAAKKEEHIPRWKRDRMKKSKQNAADNGDVYDPVNPSNTGYAEYRNKDQIERQSKQVSKLQKEQREHAEQHLAAHDAEKQETGPVISAYTASTAIWYYKDNTSGSLQGPFSAEQMLGWKTFFTLDTPVRFGHDTEGNFIELSQVDFSKPPLPMISETDNPETLSAEIPTSTVSELRSQAEGIEAESQPDESSNDDIDGEGGEETCIPPDSDDEDEGPEVDMCVPPPSDDDDDDDDDDGDQEDSDSLPAQEVDESQPSEDVLGTKLEHQADENDATCQPYYDVAYPTDDTDVVPYPVDIEYPLDNDEDLADVAYPSSNDVAFGAPEEGDPAAASPCDGAQVAPKKKYTGDKEVVGFMPSHLRIKRKK